MADQFGNYTTGLNSRCFPTDPAVEIVIYGNGAPVASPLSWQRVYINQVNGDRYENVSNAWVKQ